MFIFIIHFFPVILLKGIKQSIMNGVFCLKKTHTLPLYQDSNIYLYSPLFPFFSIEGVASVCGFLVQTSIKSNFYKEFLKFQLMQ